MKLSHYVVLNALRYWTIIPRRQTGSVSLVQVGSLSEFQDIAPLRLADAAGFADEVIAKQPRQTGNKVSTFINTYHPKLKVGGIQFYKQLCVNRASCFTQSLLFTDGN